MSVKLADVIKKDAIPMRDVYTQTLVEMTGEDDRIVTLDADLMQGMGIKAYAKAYPEHAFNCGIQEANMIGVAAGLSAVGFIPFVNTFGPFASRRCYDQIFLSVAYAGLNVKIVGGDPGIVAAYNGGTHMPFEDMGILRVIPEVTLLEPVDNVMLENLIRQVKDTYGVFYIRLMRKEPEMIYAHGSAFEIGKGIVLKDGSDVTIIASGILTVEAIKAASILGDAGISARVVNLFTWRPVDRELIETCARETGAIVTAENHSIINGLGSVVAEALAETYPVPLERVGCLERFGEVGPQDYLQTVFKLTDKDIAEAAKKVMNRKKSLSKK